MLRAPKVRSDKKLTAEEGPGQSLDPVQARQAAVVSFGLEPAELIALIERLCSCSTLRIEPGSRRRRRRAPHPSRVQWCRLGERVAGSQRVVTTKFG